MSSSAFEALVEQNTQTNPAQAKFQFTKEPALPAKCSSCGKDSTGRNRFIDWNLSIDYYGSVLLCNDCALEIVALFHYVSPTKVGLYEAKMAGLTLENAELKQQVEALKNVVVVFGLNESDSDSPPDEPLFGLDSDSSDDSPFGRSSRE